MAIDLTVATNEVLDLLNASSTPGTVDDPDWNSPTLIQADLLDEDGEVAALICSLKGHSHRQKYQASANIAHGARIPDHTGPIESVQIGGKAAQEASSVQYIERRRKTGAINPRFYLDGDTLYHTGTGTALVTFCQYSRGAVLQAPDECRPVLIAGTVARRLAKAGDNISGSDYYRQLKREGMDLIAQGAGAIPNVVPPQQ